MKIGTPSVDLITESDIYKKIEIAGRTCYKSEGNIKDEVECKYIVYYVMIQRRHHPQQYL